MRKRHLLLALFVVSLWYSWQASAQPFAIGTNSSTFFDAARNRNVPALIRYPANTAGADVPVAAGQFPTVIVAHGFQVAPGSYSHIWNTLVPLGYIVVLPNTETGLSPNHNNFGGDISFLTNAMLAENGNAASLFFNRVAPRSAIMGHSMGGGAAHLAAALGNPNITTLVSLAAAETNPSAISASSSITIPSLVIAATEDCVTPVSSNQIPMYNNIQSSCKIYYEITGGSHCHFTDGNATLCYFGEGTSCLFGWGPFISRELQHQKMFDVMIPWLNYWLKQNCNAITTVQNLLTSGSGFISQSVESGCNANLLQANAGEDQTICAGATATLTASGGTTYAWNTGQNGQTIQVSPLVTTLYKVTVSNALGCSASDQALVNVNPAPTAGAGNNQTICAGENATLTASGGVSYSWSNGQNAATITVSPTQTTTYTVTVTGSNGCTAGSSVVVTVSSNCGIVVSVKAMLQGAFNPATGAMNTTLRSIGALPLMHPYTPLPWLYTGAESVANLQNLPANMVDWILLEVRNPITGAIVERRAGLLLSNGNIVDADGQTPNGVKFFNLTANAAYTIIARHRNHLALMSRQPVTVPNTLTPLDFTVSGNEFGNGDQMVNLGGAIFGMFAADGNADGVINIQDFTRYFTDSSAAGNYLRGDFDLDGDVDGNDFLLLFRPNARVIGINEIRQ